MSIKSRVRGLEYIAAKDLQANERNFRLHPANQASALQGLLNEVGIANALIAYKSERNGGALTLIDGHLRRDSAPDSLWPVLVLDVDDHEADLLLATLDPLGAMATTDAIKLDALLGEIQTSEAEVQALLAELAQKAGLYPDGIVVDNPLDEWKGMPEFEQEAAFGAVHTLKVHFATLEDIQKFAVLVEQTVTEKTKSLWYPKQGPLDLLQYVAHDESDEP